MKNTSETQDVFTIEEAAARLRISRGSAYEAARRGEIPVLRIGRRLLVPRLALDRMLSEANSKWKAATEADGQARR